MTRMHVLRWIVACAVAIGASSLCQAKCSVSTTSLIFSTYDVFSTLPNDITGTITVKCRPSASYSLSLSPGSGTYTSRVMKNGIYTLNYNLFLDVTRLTIWGDGSSGTGIVSGTAADANHTVYGRIPARQNAHTGSYADVVVVTVTF